MVLLGGKYQLSPWSNHQTHFITEKELQDGMKLVIIVKKLASIHGKIDDVDLFKICLHL